ncbi:coadhesin-like [Actinia tenebrosa]|uniref:Coadhesin-like n=1 Tax=Actinia tenebrosa TaxID=6105 RepID=A0A6P8IWT8_ACTTE|nr:coadhesin-like [Actinia tenebrosa]
MLLGTTGRFLVIGLFIFVVPVKGDGGCRALEFLPCWQDYTFINHVIKFFRFLAPGIEECQDKCFIESKCISYNLGPIEGLTRTCELNEADHWTRPGQEVPKDGFQYCPIRNPCLSYPCPADRMCRPDFSWDTFSCDDGGWTSWSPWTNCNPSVCPYTRKRTCTNPAPQNDGANCTGPGMETKNCFIPVPAPDGCDIPFGMANGNISDSQITASSYFINPERHPDIYLPSRARLNGTSAEPDREGAWVPNTKSVGEYLQIDLGSVKMITGVATQGRQSWPQWVTEYKISYSKDNSSWIDYEGDCNEV